MSSFKANWPGFVSRVKPRNPGEFQPSKEGQKPRRPPLLFTPLELRGLRLKNRVVISPMCQYSATDGFFNDWHLVHLGSFSKGGAGLIIFEATGVESEGRITPWCTGLWSDSHIAPAARIVDFLHQHHTAAGIQLAHAGRKASCFPPFLEPRGRTAFPVESGGWEVSGPTGGQAWDPTYHTPQELTEEDIQRIKNSFVEATIRSEKAGFDLIELHAAHGYLLSSFHSPLSNKRTDKYGGDFENRTRLTREIASAMRAAWPQEKPFFVRISCTDWAEGGWTLEDSIQLAADLTKLGVDIIDCSSGGNWATQKIIPGPGFQVPLSEKIRASGVKTIAVGEITHPVQAEEILVNGRADLVAIGRKALIDPFWTLHAAKKLGAEVYWPIQYEWAVINRL